MGRKEHGRSRWALVLSLLILVLTQSTTGGAGVGAPSEGASSSCLFPEETEAPGAPLQGNTSRIPVGPFRIRLIVEYGTNRSDTAVFGVASGASPGYDSRLDLAEPPPPVHAPWVQAYFHYPANPASFDRLERSLHPPAAEVLWPLQVVVSGPGTPVRVSWLPEEVARIPPEHALILGLPGRTINMRQETSLSTAVPSGDHVLDLQVRFLQDPGPPPGAPTNLSALPGLPLGTVSLYWEPPPTEGGTPLQGYIIERKVGGHPFTPIAQVGRVTSFQDSGQAVGTWPVYRVRAVNQGGWGPPSQACAAPGTGVLQTSPHPPPGADEEDWTLVAHSEMLEPTTLTIPGNEDAVIQFSARPRPTDPRYYDLTVGIHNSPPLTVGILLGPAGLPPASLALGEVEEKTVIVPGAAVAYEVKLRTTDPTVGCPDGDCPLPIPLAPGRPQQLLLEVCVESAVSGAQCERFRVAVPQP